MWLFIFVMFSFPPDASLQWGCG